MIATLNGRQTFARIYILTDGGPQGATQTALYYVNDLRLPARALVYLLPRHPQWSNIPDAWNTAPFGTFFLNTAVFSVVTTVGQIATGMLAGYAFAVFDFPGKRVLFYLTMSGLMIPFTVVIVPVVQLLADFGWVNSWPGLPGADRVPGTDHRRGPVGGVPGTPPAAAGTVRGAGRVQGDMKPIRRSPVAVLAAAGAVLAVALTGCASAAAPSSAHQTSPAGPAGPSSRSAGTPRQQAQANAVLLLRAFAPPSGAKRVSASPVPSSPLSSGPQGGSPDDADVVTRTAWWLAPGDPRQLLAWEAAHMGAGYHRYGTGMNGPGVYNESFAVPAVAGLFDERDLTVSAVAAGRGKTAIRVDSLVDWIPVRAPGDTVPAAARVAVLTETRDPRGQGKPPVVATATLTSAGQVAALAAYLNRLPVNVPGQTYNCPQFGNGGLTVVFRARPGGPVLAQAAGSLSGCGFLTLTLPGQRPTGLNEAEAGDRLLTEADHVAGLHWKVP